MPQMLAIQTVQPQAAPSKPSRTTEQGHFSSHLEKAISSQENNKQHSDSNPSSPSTNLDAQKNNPARENGTNQQPSLVDNNGSSSTSQAKESQVEAREQTQPSELLKPNTEFSLFTEVNVNNFTLPKASAQSISPNTSIVINSTDASAIDFNRPIIPAPTYNTTGSTIYNSGAIKTGSALNTITNTSTNTVTHSVANADASITATDSISNAHQQGFKPSPVSNPAEHVAVLHKATIKIPNPVGQNTAKPIVDKATSPLIKQLQDIIDTSSEKGIVEIKRGLSPEKHQSITGNLKFANLDTAQKFNNQSPLTTTNIESVAPIAPNKTGPQDLSQSIAVSRPVTAIASANIIAVNESLPGSQLLVENDFTAQKFNNQSPLTTTNIDSVAPIAPNKTGPQDLSQSIAVSRPVAAIASANIIAVNESLPGSQFLVENDFQIKQPGKSFQQPDVLRQDSQQQLLRSRVNSQNLGDGKNFQDSQQESDNKQQSSFTLLQSGPGTGSGIAASEGSVTNTFSQVSAHLPETSSLQGSDIAKAVVTPSTPLVYEEDVMQQIQERFRIQSRNMDSKIHLKLNPAELGELKIDLTVKEGSIRANVVAQSQHTMEILEKNIQKLKSILEKQGFTIEQISITAESEPDGDFDLLDQQHFSKNEYTPTAPKSAREGAEIFTIDDIDTEISTINNSVNVKI